MAAGEAAPAEALTVMRVLDGRRRVLEAWNRERLLRLCYRFTTGGGFAAQKPEAGVDWRDGAADDAKKPAGLAAGAKSEAMRATARAHRPPPPRPLPARLHLQITCIRRLRRYPRRDGQGRRDGKERERGHGRSPAFRLHRAGLVGPGPGGHRAEARVRRGDEPAAMTAQAATRGNRRRGSPGLFEAETSLSSPLRKHYGMHTSMKAFDDKPILVVPAPRVQPSLARGQAPRSEEPEPRV